jgi:hypothetical protein
MGKQPGIFQPQHDGSRIMDTSPGRSLNRSHNSAAEQPTPGYGRTIARSLTDPTPHDPRVGRVKAAHDVKIHGGQSKQTKTGPMAFGGDHASAIDSLSGREVVPDKDGTVANAHPLTAPPTAKNLKPVALSPTMRRQTGNIARSLTDATPHSILGKLILDEAKR